MVLRIKSEIFVQSWIRKCQAAGAFPVIAKKGDADAGIIICKVVKGMNEVTAFIEEYSDTADKKWRALFEEATPEHQVDERIAQEVSFDRDLWVIEVEDREGRHFLDF